MYSEAATIQEYLRQFPNAIHLISVVIKYKQFPGSDAKNVCREKVRKYFSNSILDAMHSDGDNFQVKLQCPFRINDNEFLVCSKNPLAQEYIKMAFLQNRKRLCDSRVAIANGAATAQVKEVCDVDFVFFRIHPSK